MPAPNTHSSSDVDARLWRAAKSGHLKVVATDSTPEAAGPLFRQEVFLYQRRRLQGEVLIGTGLSWLVLGYGAVAVLAIALLFVSVLSYAKTETVRGWLVPAGGLVQLGAYQGGVVERVYVSDGEAVKAGEPLVQMRLSQQTASGDSGKLIEGAILRQLHAAQDSAAATVTNIFAERDALAHQRLLLIEREARAREIVELLQQRQLLAESKVRRLKAVRAGGYVPAQAVDDATLAALGASEAVDNERDVLLTLEQNESDMEAKLRQIPIALEQANGSAKAAAEALRGQLEKVKVGDAYTVNAQSAGVIMAMPCAQGQTVAPGATVALVRPARGRLEAELFVPSKAAGFIKAGQTVSLQYQPFAYEEFGSARARVISITRAPLSPAEVAAFGFQVNEPVFRVWAALDKPYVVAYGARRPLQVGTVLTAMIVVRRQTLLQWLFDPVLAVARR